MKKLVSLILFSLLLGTQVSARGDAMEKIKAEKNEIWAKIKSSVDDWARKLRKASGAEHLEEHLEKVLGSEVIKDLKANPEKYMDYLKNRGHYLQKASDGEL